MMITQDRARNCKNFNLNKNAVTQRVLYLILIKITESSKASQVVI